MKKLFLFLSFLSTASFPLLSQRVGLVLSGGGARGIAHIGVIQALEDNNIPIDYIAGTSMGAVVGSMYAMGYSTEEMIALIKSDEFRLWQTGKIDDSMINYFKRPEATPAFFSVKTNFSDSTKIKRRFLPQSLINPLPMNFAFMKLFAASTSRCKGDFNNLFVPFRAVASDVYNKRPLILGTGELGDAVRASMTFPFVFKPIMIDGILAYDGGIYNNYPVDVMKEDFAPDFIIGSVVSDNPAKPEEDDLMTQIDNMVMQKTRYEIDSIDGISIKFKLDDVSLLDMHKADEIYKIGYDKGIAYVDQIKKRVKREMPKEAVVINRQHYRSQDPIVKFSDVKIEGPNTLQSRFIKDQFQIKEGETLSMQDAERNYFGLLSDSKITEIMPYAKPNQEGNFDLLLNVKLNKDLETSIGGFITSMNSNRIYFGANYRILSLYAADMRMNVQLGKSYNTVNTGIRLDLPLSLPIYVNARYSFISQKYYESDKLFSLSESPCFIDQSENYGMLEIGMPLSTAGKLVFGGGYGYLRDAYYQSNQIDFSSNDADLSRYKLWCLLLKFDINRIMTRDYPTEGHRHLLQGKFLSGSDTFLPSLDQIEGTSKSDRTSENHKWVQINYKTEYYFNPSKKFAWGVSGDAFVSNKPTFSNYTATILQAPAFTPTQHSKVVFNQYFRAMNFIAVGIKPIWKINSILQLRGEIYGFQPLRRIVPGVNNKAEIKAFELDPLHLAEVSAVCKLPFASISLFVNHYSKPKNDWNFGLNIGFLINTPKFVN
ncbi:MAG: patatin-like phospholipase family protein [Bacteroidales bacterium]